MVGVKGHALWRRRGEGRAGAIAIRSPFRPPVAYFLQSRIQHRAVRLYRSIPQVNSLNPWVTSTCEVCVWLVTTVNPIWGVARVLWNMSCSSSTSLSRWVGRARNRFCSGGGQRTVETMGWPDGVAAASPRLRLSSNSISSKNKKSQKVSLGLA